MTDMQLKSFVHCVCRVKSKGRNAGQVKESGREFEIDPVRLEPELFISLLATTGLVSKVNGVYGSLFGIVQVDF